MAQQKKKVSTAAKPKPIATKKTTKPKPAKPVTKKGIRK